MRRLLDRTSRKWLRVCADIFLATLVAFVLLSLFWTIWLCDPPRAGWDRWYAGQLAEPAHCQVTTAYYYVMSIMHLVQSLLLLASPIYILWAIRMDRKKKMRLFAIWIAGGLTVTGGVIRSFYPVSGTDIMWDYTAILIWTCIDMCLGIVTASLPILDTLVFGSWRSSSRATGSNTYGMQASRSVHGTTTKSTARSGQALTDSAENIIWVDQEFELQVSGARTQERRSQYSEADEVDEVDEDPVVHSRYDKF